MKVKECKGYELEKALPNTSEDYFNRSEVTYVDEGVEKTLSVLYVRYFDQLITSLTPFSEEPIFISNSRSVALKEIVALVALLKDERLRNQKRIYINSEAEFAAVFHDLDLPKLKAICEELQL